MAHECLGQETQLRRYRTGNYADLSLSGASNQFSAAFSIYHLHGIGHKKQKLKIGYGIRSTTFIGANRFYTTAPSSLTSPVQNLATFFSETIASNIDTIATATAGTSSLNASIYFQYSITSRLDIGFNIDAVGVSFGGRKNFNVISSSFDPNQEPVQPARPTSFNVLLTSDNDIGSLNSELYIKYWLTKKVSFNAGFTFLFSEYTTLNKLSFSGGRIMNDRYRYKAGMIMIGISFKPFS